MKKSIYFYKELTRAEVGGTGTHEIYIRLSNNFDYVSFFHDTAVQNGTVKEVNFTAIDTTNGGNVPIDLRFVYFANSNKEKRIPSLANLYRNHGVNEGDIVCLESRENETGVSYYIHFYKKGEIRIEPSCIYFTQIGEKAKDIDISIDENKSFQIIYYGAPGTGKSNTIKQEVEDAGKRHHRTTFHPDSDYSTFVGAYKPSMSSSEKIYSIAELIVKLTEIKNTGTTYPCHKFASKYWESLKDLSANEIKQILAACGFTEAYGVEVSKGIAIGQEYLNKRAEGKIVYNFVPQTFTKAYVDAWNTEEEVYLIIEEINRGNCAQIFGDLFQLLDRKNGISEYPIDADSDLEDYLKEKLKDSSRTDFPEGVKEGKKLVLPSNLYIWATMNTSDQSLFPIDSAFKRRWEWKYIPIKNHPDKNYKIKIGESKYDWWQFLESINREIGTITSSEDKKLGYFFAKAEDGVIKDEQFVGKVLFYLWNDVFKNYGFDNDIFNKVNKDKLAFSDFFNADGSPNHENVNLFMKNLKVKDENKKEETNTGEGNEQ